MKSKTAIILIVALAACVAYLALHHLAKQAPEKAPESKELFASKPDTITKLTITDRNGSVLEFSGKDDQWSITKPVKAKAESWQVSSLVRDLSSLEYQHVYRAGSTEAPGTDLTGLDAPRWKVTLTDQSDKTYQLSIGRDVSLSGGEKAYVQAGENKDVFVVAMNMEKRLGKSANEYRDKDVLTLDRDRIVEVSIEGKKSFRLTRDEKKEWKLQAKDIDGPAKEAEVSKILSAVSQITAGRFVEDNPKDLGIYGLSEGRQQLVVKMWTKDATKETTTQPTSAPEVKSTLHTLALGASLTDKVFARVDDAPYVFELSDSVLKTLQPDVDSLVKEPESKPASPPTVKPAE